MKVNLNEKEIEILEIVIEYYIDCIQQIEKFRERYVILKSIQKKIKFERGKYDEST